MDDKFLSDNDKYESIVQFAMDRAKAMGAEESEVELHITYGQQLKCRNQEIENITNARNRSLSITVYKDNRNGNSFTKELSYTAIEECIKAALSIAKYTEPDPCLCLADAALLGKEYIDLDLYHPYNLTPSRALDITRKMERGALNLDKRIVNCLGASVSYNTSLSINGLSNRGIFSCPYTVFGKSISVVGEDEDGKKEHNGSGDMATQYADLDTTKKLVTEAVDDCIKALSPKKIKTGTYPIIFDVDVASMFISILCSAISGTSQYYKTTFLLNSKGEQVLPEWMSIEEKPFIKRSIYSRFIDQDGVKVSDYDVVTNGVVNDYLYSNYSAKKMNTVTNGHAGGTATLFVKDNRKDKLVTINELYKTMGTGIVVTDIMGQGFNSFTGDMSFGAKGFYVENGVVLYPISEFVISGNVKDMYKNIVEFADDIEKKSKVQMGSLLISEIKVAGI